MANGSNRSFFLGAISVLTGVVASNLIRVVTIDNARKLLLLADEARDIYQGKPIRPVPAQSEEDYGPDLKPVNYDPYYDREMSPPPPPSFDNFTPAKPVVITLNDDEDFLDKINEEVEKGNSLIEDWVDV